MSAAAPRLPRPVQLVVASEALERFAFYGARSVVTAYLAGYLVFPGRDAKGWYHAFLAATSVAPLLGAWIADRFWGRRDTILRLSLVSTAGYLLLALWQSPAGFVAGAALVAAGAGGVQACASAFVGEQLPSAEPALLDRVYGWLYWVVNLGSTLASLAVPLILQRAGPAAAFGAPCLSMAAAALVFWRGRDVYAAAPATGREPHGFFRVVARAVRRLGTHGPGQDWLDAARDLHPPEAVEGARAVLRILGVYAAVTVFWALFDQTGSSWVIQAGRLDLSLGPVTVAPAQLQALGPLLVTLLVPAFTLWAFPRLEARGRLVGPLPRMRAGMIATVLAFVAAAILQHVVDAGRAPSVLWQLPQYLLLTAGEVLVSVTGLEYSYTQAPRSMRSAIMSIWFLTIALGNLLTLTLLKLVELSEAASLWLFAALMLATSLAFGAAARRRTAPGRSG